MTNTPEKIDADDTSVYWIDGVAVSALSVAGGSPVVLANTPDAPNDLVARATDVLWSETTGSEYGNTGAVKGVPKAGGPVFVLAQGEDIPRRLALDASSVYWTEETPVGTAEGFGRIARAPAIGGAVETVVSGVTRDSPPISVSDTHVFVADRSRIKKILMFGGPVETVAVGDSDIKSLVTDAVHVYWVEDPLSTVRKAPVSGGPATTLASGSGSAGTIRVDATHVYWIDHEDLIRRIPKDGGSPATVVGPVPGLLTDFVVNGASVYFSDGGRIQKTPVTGGEFLTLANTGGRLTTDGLCVYWIDWENVWKVATTGGSTSLVSGLRASSSSFAASIVVHASNVYWTEPPISQIRWAKK